MEEKTKDQIKKEVINVIKEFEGQTITKEKAPEVIEKLIQRKDDLKKIAKDLGGTYIQYIGLFYLYLSTAYCQTNQVREAISILEEGLKNFGKQAEYEFEIKRNMYHLLGLLYADNKERITQAKKAFKEYVYYELLRSGQGGSSDGFEFYSFYPPCPMKDCPEKDHHIEDLRNYKISLSNPTTFNDPVDGPLFEWLEQQKKEHPLAAGLIRETYSNIRIRCFVRNTPLPSSKDLEPKTSSPILEYQNPLMWAHYASKHQGYCVKYVFPESFFNTKDEDRPVLFLAPVEYVSDMDVLRDITIQDAFFTKHESWSYEHEMRLIYFDKDETSDSYHKEPMLDDMITDIYFGVHCKESDKLRIIEALRGKKVQYHQMEVDPEHLYRLKAVPLDPDKIRDLYSRLADLKTCWDELMSIKDTEPAE